MTLGERIRQEREARGWSQAELASRIGGVTSQYISMLEKGKRDNPTRELLRQLAKEFGISVAELEGELDILGDTFPVSQLDQEGVTAVLSEEFLLRYQRIWPRANRNQRHRILGHLRSSADTEAWLRGLEGGSAGGVPDSADDPAYEARLVPGGI